MIIFWVLFFTAFLATYYVMPHSIRKLKEANYVVPDMYKVGKPVIPTNAGIIVLFVSYITISLQPLFVRILNFSGILENNSSDLSETNLAILLVISIYALYGLVDDLVDIGQKLKLIIPITFSFPLISVINPDILEIPFYDNFDLRTSFFSNITYGDVFRITILPVYVMVVANLVNMHSGFNGLQSGLSIIVLSALIFHSFFQGVLTNVLPLGAFFGAMVAFWFFNKYPSKVFEGNIGSLLFGAIIGCIIVVQEFWWFGFFILIPHTVNFILWIKWYKRIKYNPDSELNDKGEYMKFAKLEDDGTINPPNALTLKWLPNYFFKIGESEATHYSYLFTIIFCLLGLLLFN